MSNKDRVFGRYNYHANFSDSVNGGSLPAAIYLVNRPTTNGFISYTHVFSANILNEFRAGFARNNEVEGPALVGADVIKQIGLQGVNPPAGLPGQPIINVTGLSNTDAHSGFTHNLDTNFQYVDNVSWTKGSHFLKFGMDVIRDQLSGYSNSNNVNGTLNFTGTYAGPPYADVLLGFRKPPASPCLPPFPYLRATDLFVLRAGPVQNHQTPHSELRENFATSWTVLITTRTAPPTRSILPIYPSWFPKRD